MEFDDPRETRVELEPIVLEAAVFSVSGVVHSKNGVPVPGASTS